PTIVGDDGAPLLVDSSWQAVGTGFFTSLPSRLQFRLRRFVELQSNDAGLEGATDETYLSAVGLDSAAVVATPQGPHAESVDTPEIGTLRDLRSQWEANPYVLMEFDLRRPSSWPRSFTVTLLMVEHDHGDLASDFATLRRAVGDKVKEKAVE